LTHWSNFPMQYSDWITPDWLAPEQVASVSTTRCGGFSEGSFSGFNLASHVGDNEQHVLKNRQFLCKALRLPSEPCWLDQRHSAQVIKLSAENCHHVQADAAYTVTPGVVCGVLTADCLPVLFCNREGSCIAVAHAGWQGLLSGILENTLAALPVAAPSVLCWLGPAIGPGKYEVGEELRNRFVLKSPEHASAFQAIKADKYLADIYQIAKNILTAKDVQAISGGGYCTYTQHQKFFSYRRDGVTGRMATLLWMKSS